MASPKESLTPLHCPNCWIRKLAADRGLSKWICALHVDGFVCETRGSTRGVDTEAWELWTLQVRVAQDNRDSAAGLYLTQQVCPPVACHEALSEREDSWTAYP